MKIEAPSLRGSVSFAHGLDLVWASTRPREWIKNAFMFAPLLFGQRVLEPESVLKATAAFVVFCLAAGSVYLVNDICDREADRKHPQKRTRPVASGMLSVPMAATAAGVLLAAGLAAAFLLAFAFGVVTLAYVVLVTTYSIWLKHVVILDVFSIALGFVLRVAGGAVVIDVAMSHWLLICTMLLALFLGLSKRRHEIVTLGGDDSRRVLAEYNPIFLDMMIGVVTSATVVCYALYTVSQETVQRFHTDRLLFTLPFVLYGIFRYLYLVYHKNYGGDPSRTLVSDGPLIVDIMLWVLACGVIIYSARV